MTNKNPSLDEQLKEAEEEKVKVREKTPERKAERKIQAIKKKILEEKKAELTKEIKILENKCLNLGQEEEKIKEEARIFREKTGQAIQKKFDKVHSELILKTDNQIELRNKLKQLEEIPEVI